MPGRDYNLTKNASIDRILKLQAIDGRPQDVSGKVDPRLFTGENRLHAVMDPEYGHWYLRYEAGFLPSSLQQRWTSFPRLLTFTSEYFKRRNIEIIEII